MTGRALIVVLGALVFAALPSQAEAGGKYGRHGHGYHKGHGGHAYYSGHRNRHSYRHRGHHGTYFPFWLAPLWWGPRWHPAAPYTYHHQTTVIVEEPPVYVERPPGGAPAESWWYYCESAGGYYPDVASCPESWVKVPPRREY